MLLLSCVWLAYFILHSMLASLTAKRAVAQRWPDWMPAYRLTFNTLALLLLLLPLYLTFSLPGEFLWRWTGWSAWLANGLGLAAVAALAMSGGIYDTAEFLGVRQWRERERRVEDQERFRVSTAHRFVRHPWYALALVLLWTRDMNAPMLLSAIALTLYLLIGSRLEERKLVEYYGDVYTDYRRLVPGLLPLPGRYLTQGQASDLEQRGRR